MTVDPMIRPMVKAIVDMKSFLKRYHPFGSCHSMEEAGDVNLLVSSIAETEQQIKDEQKIRWWKSTLTRVIAMLCFILTFGLAFAWGLHAGVTLRLFA